MLSHVQPLLPHCGNCEYGWQRLELPAFAHLVLSRPAMALPFDIALDLGEAQAYVITSANGKLCKQ